MASDNGRNDSAKKASFSEAFAAARRKYKAGNGGPTFSFNGKSYTVETREEAARGKANEMARESRRSKAPAQQAEKPSPRANEIPKPIMPAPRAEIPKGGDYKAPASTGGDDSMSETRMSETRRNLQNIASAVPALGAGTTVAVRGAGLVAKGGKLAVDAAAKGGKAVVDAARPVMSRVADTVASGGRAAVDAATKGGKAAADAATKGGRAVADAATKGGRAVADAATKGGRAVADAATKGGKAAADTGRAVLERARTASEARKAAKDYVRDPDALPNFRNGGLVTRARPKSHGKAC